MIYFHLSCRQTECDTQEYGREITLYSSFTTTRRINNNRALNKYPIVAIDHTEINVTNILVVMK